MKKRFLSDSNYHNKNIGGKAYNLLKMRRNGFNVPPFFVLSNKDLEFLFADVLPEIELLFQNINSPDEVKLPSICDSVRQLILNIELSKEYSQIILNRNRHLFGENYCIAVRSSGLSEDNENTSFAGQHSTFLYCTENTLLINIKKCFASAWSYNAISYRLIHGISITGIKFAVILQKMEFAARSGICFSMNSNGNMADLVINAGYGIGEGIVSDKIEADTYYVSRANKSIIKNCVLKKHLMICDKAIVIADVPEKLQSEAVLNDNEILQVYDLSIKAETILGKPSDIEFIFSNSGELFILQMRPVTTINTKDIAVLDNTNIAESYPGITLPLSYSFAALAYSNVFRSSAKAFWVSSEKFSRNNNIFDNLLSHFYGRVYYRLDNWYRIIALVYNSKKSMKAWENAVGLPDSASNSYRFSLIGKIKTIISSFWLILNYKKGNKKFFKYFDINYNFLKDYENYLQSPETLWNYFNEAMQKTFQKWYLTIVNDFLAFKSFGWLQNLIKRFKISENQEFANELVCGYGEVESEIAVVNFLSLKDTINQSPELSAVFKLPDNEVLTIIQNRIIPEFTDKWNAYLQRFGDRTLAELKLETKSLRKNPVLLIQLIKNQLNSNISSDSFKHRQEQIKENAGTVIESRLKWYMPKRYLFFFIMKLARYGLINRENMRFCRTRMYSAAKDIFTEFGRMMVNSNIIENIDDIFYLSINEIKDFSINNNRENKHGKINGLKEKYRIYGESSLPDRIIYSVNDIPDFCYFQTMNDNNITDNKTNISREKILRGIAVSKGIAEGEAIVITEPVLNADVRGKILITKITDPGWVFLMSQSIALVSEKGSLLSHTAIVGRELGIPVVVGIQDVTLKIKTGDKIRVNGSSGIIELL